MTRQTPESLTNQLNESLLNGGEMRWIFEKHNGIWVKIENVWEKEVGVRKVRIYVYNIFTYTY